MENRGNNVNTLKISNRALVLDKIRKAPISRAEIAKETKLTKSAVTMITNSLISEGIIYELGTSDSQIGRKPILMRIVKNYRYAVGVALHRKKLLTCIANLECEIIDSEQTATADFTSYRAALDWVYQSIQLLLKRNSIDTDKIIGIGISSPGPLDYQNGIILSPPDFELFHNVPIVSLFADRFGLPVKLENNSVLLGITEYFYGCLSSYHNSLLITTRDGIGGCLLHNGSVFRGISGYAGELGHTSVDANGLQCSCGNIGCLEMYLSMGRLKDRFGFDDYNKMVDMAYENDTQALDVLDYIAKYLSCGVQNAIALLDLDSVVIEGAFNYRPDLLLSKLSKKISSRSFIPKIHPVAILSSSLGANSDARSSVAAIVTGFFQQTL